MNSTRRRNSSRLNASALQCGLTLALSLYGCGGLTETSVALGGETHFLVHCSASCDSGLSCIDGACSRSCKVGDSQCSNLGFGAECSTERVAPQEVLGPDKPPLEPSQIGVCDVLCEVDANCSGLGGEYGCEQGRCRAAPPVPSLEASTGTAESSLGAPPLSEAVDTSRCYSGRLWVGDNSPSPEMAPGSDCVGCHADTGARPLALAGTVYGPGDSKVGCYGVSGVEVRITDGIGREWKTKTNRAGNFYFEGEPADFNYPYEAQLSWVDTATRPPERFLSMPTMATLPLYGGCAHCHGSQEVPDEDWRFEVSPTDADYVNPTVPIILPGFAPNEPFTVDAHLESNSPDNR